MTQSEPASQVRSYSLNNIFNFTFSFPKVPWSVNAVAEMWLQFTFGTFLPSDNASVTDDRMANRKVFKRKYDNSKRNLLWILLLIWCFDNIRCARRSSGTVHLAVSVQSDWDYLRVCFSDWPFWASTQESTLYSSDSKEVKSVSRNKVVFISLSISLKIPW